MNQTIFLGVLLCVAGALQFVLSMFVRTRHWADTIIFTLLPLLMGIVCLVVGVLILLGKW